MHRSPKLQLKRRSDLYYLPDSSRWAKYKSNKESCSDLPKSEMAVRICRRCFRNETNRLRPKEKTMGMSDLWHETNLVYFEMQEPEA